MRSFTLHKKRVDFSKKRSTLFGINIKSLEKKTKTFLTTFRLFYFIIKEVFFIARNNINNPN